MARGQLGVAAAGTLTLLGSATWFLDHQVRRFRSEGWITRFT